MRVKLRLIFVLSDCSKISNQNHRIRVFPLVWDLRVQDGENQIVENDEFTENPSLSTLSSLHLSGKIWDARLMCSASHFEGIQIFCRVKHLELPRLSSKFSLNPVSYLSHNPSDNNANPSKCSQKPKVIAEEIWGN